MIQKVRPLIVFYQDHDVSSSVVNALSNSLTVQKVSGRETVIPLIRQARPCVFIFAKREFDLHLLTQITRLRDQLPIGLIVLSPTYSFTQEKEAFDVGADHYLLAATPTESLSIRIQSLGRKISQDRLNYSANISMLPRFESHTVVEVLGNTLLMGPTGLAVNDVRLELPPIQLELLRVFLKNEGKLFTREELIRLVWKNQKISSRSVDAQISKLKSKLVFLKDLLKNRYGTGYSFERTPIKKSA